MRTRALEIRVNDKTHQVLVADHQTLLEVLREDLGMTGTKHGCQLGECGACTVLVDGRPILSCLLLAIQIRDRTVTTIEGLATNGMPHQLQTAFAEAGAAQCGYCTPGMILSASALLDEDRDPTPRKIQEALAGNLCRCTGYNKILEAVALAANRSSGT